MPSISYRDLLAGEATLDVRYNGHVISLTYDPSAITDNTFRDIKRMAAQTLSVTAPDDDAHAAPDDTDDDAAQANQVNEVNQALSALDGILAVGDAVNALLRRFLVRWDLTDDDGVTMYPLTNERLGDLPLDFRQTCLNALLSGGQMGEANGTPSRARSHASTSTATRGGSRR